MRYTTEIGLDPGPKRFSGVMPTGWRNIKDRPSESATGLRPCHKPRHLSSEAVQGD